MGEVTEQRRRYYSGLDADMATVPAAGKFIGDQYFATDTKILYFWDGVAWTIIPLDVIVAGMIKTDAVETLKIKALNVTPGKAALGFGRYVVRRTNGWDKQVGDFTQDGNWHVDGLDLSAIVPAGAIAVHLRFTVEDNAADSAFRLRVNATDGFNAISITTLVANIGMQPDNVIAIDADRLLDYNAENVAFVAINIVVLGWFI